MKIGFCGIELPEGKTKYIDQNLIALEKKDKPKKVTPFFAEFIKEEYIHSDAIVVPEDKLLDVLILDMEKIETRLERTDDPSEKELLEKCFSSLENEVPVFDMKLSEEQLDILKLAALISLKPFVSVDPADEVNAVIEKVLEKSNYTFFYTSGPKESHAWLVKKDTNIVSCAGKIHSDLARGFIRGEVVSFEDYMKYHNFNDCKSKGVARMVNKDYKIQPFEVIEIMFSV